MTRLSPAVLHGYGLIEAPLDAVAQHFGTHKRAEQAEMQVKKTTHSVKDALAYLSVRTHPATRLVLVDLGPWTAVVANHKNGSDFMGYQFWATKTLGVPTIRVVDSRARPWQRGALRGHLGYEARIFTLHGPDGDSIRSITCADDGGRWVFETSGEPLPIEAGFAYGAPRKRDRFTSDNLAELLADVGPGVLTETRFLDAGRYALLEERHKPEAWQKRILAAACTIEEADDPAYRVYQAGLRWVPYMRTHYPSVIADFERAVAIDPAYEPKVRDYLKTAHRFAANATGSRPR